MGFKLLIPSSPPRHQCRLLAWPLWDPRTWRLRVPPDRMSGTGDTTKWPRCLHFHFVLVVFAISSMHLLLHLLPGLKVAVLQRQIKATFLSFHRLSAPGAPFCLFCFFLRRWVFTDLHQRPSAITPSSHPAYRSWDAFLFIVRPEWISLSVRAQCNQQTDSSTWLV